MRVKNLFSIFLTLVLVSVGVLFVIGSSNFTSPTNNITVVSGNYTITVTTTDVTNATDVLFYNFSKTDTSYKDYFNTTHMANISTGGGIGTGTTTVSYLINTHNITDGNYTIMALIMNSSRTGNVTINTTIYVDNTPPDSLILIHPNMSQEFIDNTTIQFGFNVTDSMSNNITNVSSSTRNLLNCSLIIDGSSINSSIVVWNTTDDTPLYSIDVPTGNSVKASYMFNVSVQDLDSGYHTWNISCWDQGNNLNGSAEMDGLMNPGGRGGNFTITDTAGPTTSTPTLSSTSVTQDTTVTVTCSGSDAISSDPTEMVSIRAPNGEWQNGIGSSPYSFTGTSTVGTYYARCYSVDTAGNVGGNTAEVTFSVTRTSSTSTTDSSTGSGGGTVTSKVNVLRGQTEDLGSIAGGQGVINAYETSVVNFDVITSSISTSGSHSIRFDEIDVVNEKIKITISSDPITLTMEVGDVETVDVDGDGINDLELTFNSVDTNGQVNLNVKDLVGEAATPSEEETTTGEETTAEEKVSKGMSWIWWVIIIIVIIIIVALILPKRRK